MAHSQNSVFVKALALVIIAGVLFGAGYQLGRAHGEDQAFVAYGMMSYDARAQGLRQGLEALAMLDRGEHAALAETVSAVTRAQYLSLEDPQAWPQGEARVLQAFDDVRRSVAEHCAEPYQALSVPEQLSVCTALRTD